MPSQWHSHRNVRKHCKYQIKQYIFIGQTTKLYNFQYKKCIPLNLLVILKTCDSEHTPSFRALLESRCYCYCYIPVLQDAPADQGMLLHWQTFNKNVHVPSLLYELFIHFYFFCNARHILFVIHYSQQNIFVIIKTITETSYQNAVNSCYVRYINIGQLFSWTLHIRDMSYKMTSIESSYVK